VLVDDLRWDEISAAGHPYVKTPNIDRIASEGAYFTNAFTTTPLWSLARATFLTGPNPHASGISNIWHSLEL
jgi:arylsulfatase A-like enzyme